MLDRKTGVDLATLALLRDKTTFSEYEYPRLLTVYRHFVRDMKERGELDTDCTITAFLLLAQEVKDGKTPVSEFGPYAREIEGILHEEESQNNHGSQ